MPDHLRRAPTHEYDSLHADDDDRDSSDLDIEETAALHDKDYLPEPLRSRKQRVLDAARRHRYILDIILAVIIVGLLIDRQWARPASASCPQTEGPQYQGTGDITGFAPKISQKIVTFQPDSGYLPANSSEFFTKETKQKWLDLVPKGLGYLQIEDPEKYHDLPQAVKGYKGYVVTTSMTHQLHCLYAIAELFSAYNAGMTEKIPEDPWHLGHCFDYIRQGIMCSGDIALEGQQTTFPAGVIGTDGWDAKHVCKNYDEVLDYLEQKRANDKVWIA
ncbi:hypothetical protein BX600DRAFT_554465 [Xylariales sp. PMI_506]|nr:hypothetical protein BX600DRAFT_554465 [Xylariales sp. PMI_506]